jgi:hypothetical protein
VGGNDDSAVLLGLISYIIVNIVIYIIFNMVNISYTIFMFNIIVIYNMMIQHDP